MHPGSIPVPIRPAGTRRHLLAACGAAALWGPVSLRAQKSPQRLRILLNTSFSSPQAWLWLALGRGYLAEEGIELDLTPGSGAYTAAPRMLEGSYDLAYGDVNSLIEVWARNPEQAPRGVYMMFNASPSCVLVAAQGPIQHPRQLIGQRLIGHDSDVARRTFGALCRQLKLDLQQMSVSGTWAGMAGMAQEVASGRAAGAFGYESTFTGALVAAEPALLRQVRFLRYADHVPDLYGSAVMASQRLLRDEPQTVSRVVRALHRGVVDMLRDPEAGLEAVMRAAPGLHRQAERARLKATLEVEMNQTRHTTSRPVAMGDIDTTRLERGIALMLSGTQVSYTPGAHEIFTRAHLPAAAQRAAP